MPEHTMLTRVDRELTDSDEAAVIRRRIDQHLRTHVTSKPSANLLASGCEEYHCPGQQDFVNHREICSMYSKDDDESGEFWSPWSFDSTRIEQDTGTQSTRYHALIRVHAYPRSPTPNFNLLPGSSHCQKSV